MRTSPRTLLPLVLVLSPLSCVGTETGNPDVAKISMRLVSSEPSRIIVPKEGAEYVAPSAADALVIDSAQFRVRELAFTSCEEGKPVIANEESFSEEGETYSLPAGSYCGFTFTVEGEEGERAMLLSGWYRDARQPIIFDLAEGFTSEQASDTAVSIDEGMNLILSIDLATVIAPGVLSDLQTTPNNDLAFRVDSENNAWLADEMREGFPAAVRLFEDVDEDGELNPNELAEPLL